MDQIISIAPFLYGTFTPKLKAPFIIPLLLTTFIAWGQLKNSLQKFTIYEDVTVTIDVSLPQNKKQETLIILYALPNGNNTEQTMGKKMTAGDDWHFDIQHIKAQTAFIREEMQNKNIVVVYLENSYKSWPQWKTKHPLYKDEVQNIVDTILSFFEGKKWLCLNGHSGGGRFVFSYLDGVEYIPSYVKNISFLDSNYGYDSTCLGKLASWLKQYDDVHLNVFAYNDSVALLNGKRFVSDTGGTWYRSHLMLKHLTGHFTFSKLKDDSLIVYQSSDKKIAFFLKKNPDRKIFHTQQVGLNGFIHSILIGTKRESRKYVYFGKRAYSRFIE